MVETFPVAIVGAGPYGLSIAAHLTENGVPFKLFGPPMAAWRTEMPARMQLKSEGFASNLADPAGEFTLARYCRDNGLEYADRGYAVPLSTLTEYGLAFQKRYVPTLDPRLVSEVDIDGTGFRVTLADGETQRFGAVVVASGISAFRHRPEVLARLPSELSTHSAEHRDLTQFNGRHVAVVGAGASGLGLAGLLQEDGAKVTAIAREPKIEIHTKPVLPRPFLERVRAPMSGIGPGWRSLAYCEAPFLFYYVPERYRHRIVRYGIPPAAGWYMQGRIEGKVDLRLGQVIEAAEAIGERVRLTLAGSDGDRHTVEVDHVIAATGYRADLRRLPFLTARLRACIRERAETPVLSPQFESSVPGLFFAGPVSANCFGLPLKFIVGAKFAARRISVALKPRRFGTNLAKAGAASHVPAWGAARTTRAPTKPVASGVDA